MTAYAFVELTIHDRAAMKPYFDVVEPTVRAHGGRYVIRDPDPHVLEGDFGAHPLKVMLEFESMEAAQAWYDSPEYQAIIEHRTACSTANFMLLQGV